MRPFLAGLNTHAVAVGGAVIGGGTLIVAAVASFFHLVEDPHYLQALYYAFVHLKHHQTLSDGDVFVLAQLVGVNIAIIGAVVLSLLAAVFGRSPAEPKGP